MRLWRLQEIMEVSGGYLIYGGLWRLREVIEVMGDYKGYGR